MTCQERHQEIIEERVNFKYELRYKRDFLYRGKSSVGHGQHYDMDIARKIKA